MKQFLNVAARAIGVWLLSAAIFVGLPFLLFGCDGHHEQPYSKNVVNIANTEYGSVYRIEDDERGNLIYVFESHSTGNGGITVVPLPKK